jgi:hypothetical protein
MRIFRSQHDFERVWTEDSHDNARCFDVRAENAVRIGMVDRNNALEIWAIHDVEPLARAARYLESVACARVRERTCERAFELR